MVSQFELVLECKEVFLESAFLFHSYVRNGTRPEHHLNQPYQNSTTSFCFFSYVKVGCSKTTLARRFSLQSAAAPHVRAIIIVYWEKMRRKTWHVSSAPATILLKYKQNSPTLPHRWRTSFYGKPKALTAPLYCWIKRRYCSFFFHFFSLSPERDPIEARRCFPQGGSFH